MKKNLFFFLLFTFQFQLLPCKAQNLVPNPGFEQYSNCPIDALGDGQIYLATGWENWGITPDYFNVCGDYMGIPSNFVGYQNAFEGNAYAGICIYYSSLMVREFIGVRLTQPLTVGQMYYVSFYASLNLNQSYSINCSIDKLGIKFFTNNTHPNDSLNISFVDSLVNNTAHVYSNTIISDTTNWTLVNGFFTADSAYQYMVVGNFFDSLHLNGIKYFNTPQYSTTYFYVDNFNVSATQAGIDNQGPNDFSVFPNPVDDILTILGDFNSTPQIELYDVNMNPIPITAINNGNQIQIPMSEYNNGIYFIKVITNKNSYIKKILINH